MKVNQQQKQWLKAYLRAVLKYHETYEEVYDHILLALETRPQEKFFESSVNAIITDDFGGINGLSAMEENCKNVVITEVQTQYRRYFFSYLKFPNVIYAAVISIMVCYIAIHVSFNVVILSGSIWALCAIGIPGLLFAGRNFKIGYKLEGSKKLLKDSILETLAYKPFKFFWWYGLLNILEHYIQGIFNYKIVFDLWKFIDPVILIVIFVGATIHCISFIRIIKSEFKISMIR